MRPNLEFSLKFPWRFREKKKNWDLLQLFMKGRKKVDVGEFLIFLDRKKCWRLQNCWLIALVEVARSGGESLMRI